MTTKLHSSVTRADPDNHPPGTVTDYLPLTDQVGDPAAPASGHALYAKAGGIYAEDSTGTVTALGLPPVSPATTVTDDSALDGTPVVGTGTDYARDDHAHGSPSTATIAAVADAQIAAQSGVSGGFAPLSSGLLVPAAYLGTGTPDGTQFLRDDGVWAAPVASVAEIAALPTAATDPSLVLAPDGAGGVHFRAETANVSTYGALTVDYGELQRLTKTITNATYGDHFNAATLDAKWGAYSGARGDWNTTDLPGWARMAGAAYRALVQTIPSGSWTIECEVMNGPTDAAAFGGDGLIVSNAATQGTSIDMRLGFGYDNSLRAFRVVWEKWVNGAYNGAYAGSAPTAPWGGIAAPMGGPFFLRLQFDSSAVKFYARWSVNRFSWVALTLGQPIAPGFTPAYFGINGAVQGAYFNYFDKVA